MRAVHRHLLERLHQFAGTLQVGDELVGRLAHAGHEVLEPRAAQLLALDLLGEALAAPRQARGDRDGDAHRVVDLVGDAGHEAAKRGELLGLDEILLRQAQIGQGLLGPLLGGDQLAFRPLLGDGVAAEHVDGAGHLARLIAGGAAGHLEVVAAAHDLVHRHHELAQRLVDRARHADADDDDGEDEQEGDDPDLDVDLLQGAVEARLRHVLLAAEGRRHLVDGGRHAQRARVDLALQQLVLVVEAAGQGGEAAAQDAGPLAQRLERPPLQVAGGEIEHDGHRLLDGLGVAARVLAGLGRDGQIVGVGGQQGGVERLARLAERRPDQCPASLGLAVDDGIEAGHLLGGVENLLLVGLLQSGANIAQAIEAGEELLGGGGERVGLLGKGALQRGGQELGDQRGAAALDLHKELGRRPE